MVENVTDSYEKARTKMLRGMGCRLAKCAACEVEHGFSLRARSMEGQLLAVDAEHVVLSVGQNLANKAIAGLSLQHTKNYLQ